MYCCKTKLSGNVPYAIFKVKGQPETKNEMSIPSVWNGIKMAKINPIQNWASQSERGTVCVYSLNHGKP